MKRLFIEVQYDPELAEVEEIDCSGTGRNAYITPPTNSLRFSSSRQMKSANSL